MSTVKLDGPTIY